MKPKYLVLLCLFATIGLWGQETNEKKEAKWFMGGTVNYAENNQPFFSNLSSTGTSNSTSEFVKSRRFSIASYLGRSISPHWSIGLGLNYELTTYKNDAHRFMPFQTGTLTRTTNGVGARFFGRYTINPVKKLQFFLQPTLSYNWKKFRTVDPTRETISTILSYQIGTTVGLRYQLNKRLGIIGQIGRVFYKRTKEVDWSIGQEYNFDVDFNPSNFFWGLELNF